MNNRVGQQLGNYRLIQLLGAGGFAEVYLGEHMLLGTQAAIKILDTRIQQQEANKFLAEARTIARLIHPHIIRLLEFGIEGSTPFMVMDYAPNGTLKDRHPKGTQLPLPTVVSYVKQIADALQFAHDEKIIHRDIKPANILIGRRIEILLSDFGIAVIAHSTLSRKTEELIGTPAYMAPEQIQKHPTPASDQYALAIIVYEWLSGSPPFDGTEAEIAIKHLSVPPPLLSTKNPSLPSDVEQVVLKALAKEPWQRFARIQDFADALEQATQATLLIHPLTPLAPTVPVWNAVNSTIVQASIPTPPLIISKPTEQDINKALNSPVNPYAPWGKLALDETSKKNFSYQQSFLSKHSNHFRYIGETCELQTDEDKSYLIAFAKETTCSDFVFQVEMTVLRSDGGIVFRANSKHTDFYYFCIDNGGDYLLEFINAKNSVILAQGGIPACPEPGGRYKYDTLTREITCLMSVVAQKRFLDLYYNFYHLTRIEDYSRNSGEIGIAVGIDLAMKQAISYSRNRKNALHRLTTVARFRRGKLWVP